MDCALPSSLVQAVLRRLGCTHFSETSNKYCSYSYVENACRWFHIVNAIGCIWIVRITLAMYLVVQAVQVFFSVHKWFVKNVF
jgi:hypothetical protein